MTSIFQPKYLRRLMAVETLPSRKKPYQRISAKPDIDATL
jgi:hypothetical protein